MVRYNPREWFGLIFKFHRAETFRKLIWVLLSLAIYSGAIAYLEIKVWKLEHAGTTTAHFLLGFIISLLLVFRTNTAYDRWWEGRKQWGALVNVSRNLAFKIKAFLPDAELQRKRELRDMTGTYATILKSHLRDMPSAELSKDLPEFLQKEGETPVHVPNYLALAMQNSVLDMHRKKEISEAAYLAMLNDLNAFTDICGACERIKKTPIPYTYNIFIKKFIFAYIITMPFGFVNDFGYWIIGITVFTFYAFASLEMIAEEIEDPFGSDSNDLPTDTLSETIRNNVNEIIPD